MSSQSRLFSTFKVISRTASITVVASGIIGFFGGLEPPAALGFVLAGVSLWFLQNEWLNRRDTWITVTCAFLLVAIAGWSLHEYFSMVRAAGVILSERMAPVASFSLLLVGLAMVLVKDPRSYWLARVMIFVTMGIALIACVSFAYGVNSIYVNGPYTGQAPVFLVLCLGIIFAHPARGFMGILTGETAGAVMARHLFPAAILMPVVLGWLTLAGGRAGLFGIYGLEFGLSFLVVLSIVIFCFLIWRSTRSLNQIDAQRRRVEEALRKSYAQTEQLLSSITSILIGVTQDGIVKYWNGVAESTLNLAATDVIGRLFSVSPIQLSWPDFLSQIHECKRSNQPIHLSDMEYRRPDGQKGFLGFTMIPIRGAKEDREWFLLFGTEITKRKQLNELKDEFVRTVSHELRTPLAITKEGILLVLDRIAGTINEKQESILRMAKNNIDRLARIIDELLDISKIEAGRVELHKGKADLASLIQQVISSFSLRAREKGLDLRVLCPKRSIEVYADGDKVLQVLTNLMGNAIKFTSKGFVEITVAENGGEVECAVQDTGIGVSKEDLPKMFTKFQQFGRSVGGGENGTGLGLVIAKGIVEMHHGKIWVESTLGRGTRLVFTLPKYAPEKLLVMNN